VGERNGDLLLFFAILFLSSCSAESVVDYFLLGFEGGVEATFDWLLFFPPWEGDGALLPRLTVALFDPLLPLLLPWAGGGMEDCTPARH
jgi:hypothetical protein